jgi:imidazolonepropionase-like amidohydrolase
MTVTPELTLYRCGGVFDGLGERAVPGAALLVGAGVVQAVGDPGQLARPGVAVRDLGAGVIVPGFVDAHTHITIRPGEGDQHAQMLRPAPWQTIRGVANLQQMLRSGVTTARIMTEERGIDFEFRDAVARGEVCGPQLLVSGPGLSPSGGHGSAAGGVAGVIDLRAAVRARAACGADHIKIFTTGGVSSANTSLGESNYSGEEIAAIVGEAAAAGLRVSAHAHGGPGVDLAVDNGIHSIEHGALLDAGNLERMDRHRTWLVLTNTILFHPSGIERGDARVPQIMDKVLQARVSAAANAAAIRKAAIPLALGTDSMHGLFGYELQWMVEHGWTAAEALRAATSGGAALVGLSDRGVLRPGCRADFVVLRADPFDDITGAQNVHSVYRDGHEVVTPDGSLRPHVQPG